MGLFAEKKMIILNLSFKSKILTLYFADLLIVIFFEWNLFLLKMYQILRFLV